MTASPSVDPIESLNALSYQGSDKIVAAFQVGWEVAHLQELAQVPAVVQVVAPVPGPGPGRRSWLRPRSRGQSPDQVPAPVPAPGPKVKLEELEEKDLERAARKILRIESAFKDLGVLVITTDGLPIAVPGKHYKTQLAATGGSAPYQWSIASGVLPKTLSLSGTGLITGNPVDDDGGNYIIVVQAASNAADSSSSPEDVAYQVLTLGVGEKVLVVRADNFTGQVKRKEYQGQLTVEGGVGPYSWTVDATTLPVGVKGPDGAGNFSGKPEEDGQFPLVVTVSDRSVPPRTAKVTLTLKILGEYDYLFGLTSYPATADLRRALAGSQECRAPFQVAIDAFDRDMRRAFAMSKASAPLPQANDGELATSTAVTSALGDAYELGWQLARIYLDGSESGADETGLRNAISLRSRPGMPTVGPVSSGPDPDRTHALLMSLRGYFPSGAAYSVARHIEDWSDWLAGSTLDSTVTPLPTRGKPDATNLLVACKAALRTQGKVWESIMTGQALCKDFVSAASYADGADHLLVAWSRSVTTFARGMRKTTIGRIAIGAFFVLVLVFLGALVNALLNPQGASGTKAAVSLTAVVAAAVSAAGIYHVSRTQVTSVAGRAWQLAGPMLVNAETLESVAIATRRLPYDGVAGGADTSKRALPRKKRIRKVRHPQRG